MPADVSFHNVSTRSVSVDAAAPSRLPLGLGLFVAASASVGLWWGIAAGVRALLF
jgi:hypothetical protein